jgi:hypothetical protein
VTPQPNNAFHQNLAIIEGRQKTLDERMGTLATAMPENAGMEASLSNLGAALIQSGQVQAELSALQVKEMARLAHATERVGEVLSTQLQPARDAPAILLYLGVGPHGGFDQHSNLGQLLIQACGEKRSSLVWLFHSSKTRKHEVVGRDVFVANARGAAASLGLQDIWSDYDFGRFHDLAPYVWRLIETARSASSDPTGDATAQ